MALKRVLVYGGMGSLGAVCARHLKDMGYWVCSVDLKENCVADCNVLINEFDSLSSQHNAVHQNVSGLLECSSLDAILCVAGGWAGGNTGSKDFSTSCETTWKQSVWSSCIASSLASKFLSSGGLLVLTGAEAAIQATPSMIGYGMAKAAVHHLTASLAAEGSGLPNGSHVVCILPKILDTPMNRKWMPKADHSSWTPLDTVAKLLVSWIEGQNRPTSGSQIRLITKNGETELSPIP
ncbi:unnamed protein product [Dicrocoelium dendriticum]|nr:unnamed protein product [Dicrocoelium dendriticum]